jgi:hypothetical protein
VGGLLERTSITVNGSEDAFRDKQPGVTNTGCLVSTHVLAVRPWLSFLYLVVLLHLPSFFRFVVLV